MRPAVRDVDYLFTSYTKGQIDTYAEILRPFGEIVAIDDEHQDMYPLKSTSITRHWELMFTRSMHAAGIGRAHEIVASGQTTGKVVVHR